MRKIKNIVLSLFCSFFLTGQSFAASILDIDAGVTTGEELSLSDSTVNNFSLTKHGFAPKGTSTTGRFLRGNGTWEAPSGGSGDVVGPAASVDNEIAIFSGTTGKVIKRATITGIVKTTSGVIGTATAGTDYLSPTGSGAGLTGMVASQVGLGSATNTSDADKPVSTAQQTVLDLKLDDSQATSFGLSLIDDVDALAARITLSLGTLATQSGTFSGTSTGTNTGDNATNSQYSSLVSNATHTGDVLGGTSTTVVGVNGTIMSNLATGILKNTTTTGVPSIAVAGDFPTLNQNTSGTASNVTGTVLVANGGSGATTLTGMLVGSGTSAFTGVAGTAAQLLRRNASNTAYEFFTHSFAASGTNDDITVLVPPSVPLRITGGLQIISTGTPIAGTGLELAGGASPYIQAYNRDTPGFLPINVYSSTFQFNPSVSGLVKIDIAGNVSVGTTTASAQIHTTGTVRMQNFGAGTATFDANGNISSVSDERLKTVDREFLVGLNQILGINPIQYHWNDLSGLDKDNLYTGFSAQNIRKWIPEAVSIDSRGYYNLQDRVLTAALVNAVKQLTVEIDDLRTKLALTKIDRTSIDRTGESSSVVKSKVTALEKQCEVDEVVKETKEVTESIDGIDTVISKEVLKPGITEKEGKYFRLESDTEATQRYNDISQN